MTDHTRAFALDPGRVYIHLKGKYPRGSVPSSDRRVVEEEIDALFRALEVDREQVIGQVYRGEEIYHGPHAHLGPDIVLLGNSGYNLRGNMKAAEIYGSDILTGKHSQTDAFLLAWGAVDTGDVPRMPTVFDVVRVLQSSTI